MNCRFVRLPSSALLLILAALLPTIAGAQSNPPQRWFEIDALNPGLGEAPDDLDRSTPRQTVSQLLILGDRKEFRRAAHLLDLSEFPEDEQANRGPELARKLVEIINRTTVIDWSELPARPDALLPRAVDDAALAGQPRRSLELNLLELPRRPAEIRLSRLNPAEGEPLWVISSQTVRDIDALYDRYGPGWLEEMLPDVLRKEAPMGTRTWEWLALPLAIALLFLLGCIVHKLLGVLGRGLTIDWLDRAADRIRLPLTVALMALVGQVLAGWVISFSGFFYTLLTPVLLGLVIIGFTVAALRTIDATLDIVTDRYVDEIDDSKDRDRRSLYTSIYALRRLVILVAVLVGAALFLVELRLFENIGLSLLASAGVLTVILGIAGQTVLGNILASLQIAIAKPVRIGDAVHYEDQWAYVESIYYSYLVLRTWDGRRQIVPVQYFISHPFENWSMVEASLTRKVVIRLDHSAEPGKLRKAFEKLVGKDERAIDGELLMTAVTDHNEDYQEITFYATAANPTDAWLMQLDLREGIADWIRRYHPEWWPRDRLLSDDGGTKGTGKKSNSPKRTGNDGG